jgi:glycosyltransferase involved in cell wall biosynthesis
MTAQQTHSSDSAFDRVPERADVWPLPTRDEDTAAEDVLRVALVLRTSKAGPELVSLWRPDALPLYWECLLHALPTGVEIDVVLAPMRPVLRGRLLRRQLAFPPVRLVHSLARSRTSIFLSVEYSLATLVTALVAKLRSKRLVLFQENAGRGGHRLTAGSRLYRRILIGMADAVIANTDRAYAELTKTLGTHPRKIHRATLLVPPGRDELCRHLVKPPEPHRRPVILFSGRLIPEKNVSGLLEAAASVHASGVDFELWIAGDGPERSALEQRTSHLVRKGVVRFLGPWPPTAVGWLYDAADVFVMPSLSDYRSMAVLEAQRFGLPIVGSTYDGNAGETVRHDVTGLLFDPGEPGALESALRRALIEPRTLRQLSRNATEEISRHTTHTAAAELTRILRHVGGTDE